MIYELTHISYVFIWTREGDRYQKDVEPSGVFQGHMKDGSQQSSDHSTSSIIEGPALPFRTKFRWTQHLSSSFGVVWMEVEEVEFRVYV